MLTVAIKAGRLLDKGFPAFHKRDMIRKKRIIKAVLPFLLSAAFLASSEARGIRVAFVGDPQVDNEQELEYARRSVYGELMERKDLDMVVFLGDLVNDNVSLLEPTRQILDSLPMPWFNVPGNHDRDLYVKSADGTRRIRDLKSYRRVIGAPDTTFVRGRIRFILMNNVRHAEKGEYEGGLTEKQRHYLDSAVASSSEKMVVFASHIPLSHSKGTDSLLAILSRCPELLVVCGHTHNVARRPMLLPDGRRIEELVAGASCGSWWRGVKDGDGIPYALQNCGAPRGYFIADITARGRCRLKYKCVGRCDSDVVSAHWQSSRNDTGADTSGSDAHGTLTINVYGGSVDGVVEVKGISGNSWTRLEHVDDIAPEVLEVINDNKVKTKEERRAHPEEFIPLRRFRSPHIWAVSADCPAGTIKVRYRDSAMSFCSRTVVRL